MGHSKVRENLGSQQLEGMGYFLYYPSLSERKAVKRCHRSLLEWRWQRHELREGTFIMKKQAQTSFIQGVYSTFWEKQVKVYGFTEYHEKLLALLQSLPGVPPGSRVLEVGIGTGFPFACSLSEKGFEVHGVDLAERLVERCRSEYPKIHARVGDAEALPYGNEEFPLCYCLQSTWYFPRLAVALSEMFRVTRRGGTVVFDVINSIAPLIIYRHWIRKFLLERAVKAALNGLACLASRPPRYDLQLHESPANPFTVRKTLGRAGGGLEWVLSTPQKLGAGAHIRFTDYVNPRLVFVCRKT